MQDKRRFPRFDCSLRVCYTTQGRVSVESDTIARNISAGGVCMTVSRVVKKEDVLTLNIYPPDANEPVQTIGKVIWTRPSDSNSQFHLEAGIKFTRTEPETMRRLMPNAEF